MKKAAFALMSLWFWSELFLTSAILFTGALLLWLVTFAFDPRRVLLHRYSCLWSDLVFFLNPLWKVRVSGKERIKPGETFVIVSNHQSGSDILVLFSLHIHYKWVAKKSLYWFPFIGWNMALNRYIALERGRKSSMRHMIERCKEEIGKGSSVMIFPEGTRSKDGSLQPFKSGAFRIALESKVAILPIVIKGTSQAIRKGGFIIRKNTNIRLVVLDPVPYEVFREMEPKDAAILVRSKVEAELSR
jgi:1-acyl-sn-glycerol-3-phosphate acyltransferase